MESSVYDIGCMAASVADVRILVRVWASLSRNAFLLGYIENGIECSNLPNGTG